MNPQTDCIASCVLGMHSFLPSFIHSFKQVFLFSLEHCTLELHLCLNSCCSRDLFAEVTYATFDITKPFLSCQQMICVWIQANCQRGSTILPLLYCLKVALNTSEGLGKSVWNLDSKGAVKGWFKSNENFSVEKKLHSLVFFAPQERLETCACVDIF